MPDNYFDAVHEVLTQWHRTLMRDVGDGVSVSVTMSAEGMVISTNAVEASRAIAAFLAARGDDRFRVTGPPEIPGGEPARPNRRPRVKSRFAREEVV